MLPRKNASGQLRELRFRAKRTNLFQRWQLGGLHRLLWRRGLRARSAGIAILRALQLRHPDDHLHKRVRMAELGYSGMLQSGVYARRGELGKMRQLQRGHKVPHVHERVSMGGVGVMQWGTVRAGRDGQFGLR